MDRVHFVLDPFAGGAVNVICGARAPRWWQDRLRYFGDGPVHPACRNCQALIAKQPEQYQRGNW